MAHIPLGHGGCEIVDMNAQAADIDTVGSKAYVEVVIRHEQLTKRYTDGNILAVNRLNLRVHATKRRSARC